MKHTICYVSKAIDNLSEESVEDIFQSTIANNNSQGVTGILLYGFGNFFQVIEGNKRQILRLFAKIKTDDRHHRIETLINHSIKKPVFGSYSSTFNIVKTKTQLKDISDYLNLLNYNVVFSDRMKRLIHPFLLSL